MRIKFCPNCRSRDISLVMGGITGVYECKKCGFQGTIFPEIETEKEKKK